MRMRTLEEEKLAMAMRGGRGGGVGVFVVVLNEKGWSLKYIEEGSFEFLWIEGQVGLETDWSNSTNQESTCICSCLEEYQLNLWWPNHMSLSKDSFKIFFFFFLILIFLKKYCWFNYHRIHL